MVFSAIPMSMHNKNALIGVVVRKSALLVGVVAGQVQFLFKKTIEGGEGLGLCKEIKKRGRGKK